MFRPGHLDIRSEALGAFPAYRFDLDYALRQDDDGPYVHFDLVGEVSGQPFQDRFRLHRDVAYNFLHRACRCLRRHGLAPGALEPLAHHRDYVRVFDDLRAQLHAAPGTPVDLERFLREREE